MATAAEKQSANWVRFSFCWESRTALLLHADNIEAAEFVDVWRKHPDNQNLANKKKADDRSPAWTWMGYIPTDERTRLAAIPDYYLTSMMAAAGTQIPHPKGGRKTYKEAASSAIIPADGAEFFNIEIKKISDGLEKSLRDDPGNRDKLVASLPYSTIDMHAICGQLRIGKGDDLTNEFTDHIRVARASGFRFDMRRAKVGAAKHVRIRPLFHFWRVRGIIMVNTAEVPLNKLREIHCKAGDRGLGDWRPSSPKPGKFGQFNATVEPVEDK